MAKNPGARVIADLNQQGEQVSLGSDNLLGLLEIALGPVSLVFSLWGLAYFFEGTLAPDYLLLGILVFALSFPGQLMLKSTVMSAAIDALVHWGWIAGLLLITGFVTGYIDEYSAAIISTWMWLAPLTHFLVGLVLRGAVPTLLRMQGPKKRAIIAGMNEQGLSLARRISESPYSRVEIVGFVDSRDSGRLGSSAKHPLLDQLEELANLVRTKNVQIIYLSLPMASQPRILAALDSLKDTTASIYFVPDMFVTDLIQSHVSSVYGMPVISVCETPFRGSDGVIKRVSDIVLSLLILALVTPLMLLIALAVRLESPGPIIFRQRRYGLDGEEIVVFKFRSMRVTEDGGEIVQARPNDSRLTRLGAFLRRTSLDELPQFLNVLQGRMSIVGPRPHAVAHNELYRKLIKGYMVRHKVKPGITGWAQVNGFRGETETLDKMQSRIDFDLDYLRNWTLSLDLYIILKTLRVVFRDAKAY